jgi:Nucleotide-diphospho-sugar transferase
MAITTKPSTMSKSLKFRVSSSSRGNNITSKQNILSHLLFGCCCMYVGLIMGMSFQPSSQNCPPCPAVTDSEPTTQQKKSSLTMTMSRKFPRSLDNMFVDYGTVPRQSFNEHLEIGVPFDPTIAGAEDVLVLYTSQKSLPTAAKNSSLYRLPSEQAFENCHSVKVILQEHNKRRKSQQCIAIVPQWESYYVHKFMRLPRTKFKTNVDYKYPLRYVSRSHSDDGKFATVPMLLGHTDTYYKVLQEYLANLDRVVYDLHALLRVKRRKGPSNSNAFIVMVCNLGQSALLHNFICNAKAKNIDLSRVVVFATDEATKTLCEGLGITVFYDKSIFGAMPETAAMGYGDRVFAKMMMAKVFCVHLVLSCGYDVLFQDVDVVMYKNPLPFFASDEVAEWDMMFQGKKTIDEDGLQRTIFEIVLYFFVCLTLLDIINYIQR